MFTSPLQFYSMINICQSFLSWFYLNEKSLNLWIFCRNECVKLRSIYLWFVSMFKTVLYSHHTYSSTMYVHVSMVEMIVLAFNGCGSAFFQCSPIIKAISTIIYIFIHFKTIIDAVMFFVRNESVLILFILIMMLIKEIIMIFHVRKEKKMLRVKHIFYICEEERYRKSSLLLLLNKKRTSCLCL